MRYFELLNLRREPFSNSPDPDLFYRTKQHRECLQSLEIAIRLKRGLSVVTGHVGTGKTTLCRQLLRVLAERQGVDTHLILDPYFSDEREFLVHLNSLFGVAREQAAALSDWELRENIKAALYRLAVEQGRLVVLIVDEGQKMSLVCLEILRELLNYETNEHKLLQIVIFGQLEFEPLLEAKANLADRVNFRFRLGPLDFQDTRELIHARLAMCAKDITPEGLFSFWALLAVYLATDGFPRQIVQLCHQALLAVIIKERPRVTWGVVRSCMRWRTLGLPRRRRWPRMLAAGVAAAMLLTGGLGYFAFSPQAGGLARETLEFKIADKASSAWASVKGAFARGQKPAEGAVDTPKAVSGEDGNARAAGQAVSPLAAPEAQSQPGAPPSGQTAVDKAVQSSEQDQRLAALSGAGNPQSPEARVQPDQPSGEGDHSSPDAAKAGPVFLGVLVAPGPDADFVEILTGMPVERFEASHKPGPARIVVDLAGHWERKGEREVKVGAGRIDKVRNAVHPDKLRVAIYLGDASAGTGQPLVEKTPRGLRVIVK